MAVWETPKEEENTQNETTLMFESDIESLDDTETVDGRTLDEIIPLAKERGDRFSMPTSPKTSGQGKLRRSQMLRMSQREGSGVRRWKLWGPEGEGSGDRATSWSTMSEGHQVTGVGDRGRTRSVSAESARLCQDAA